MYSLIISKLHLNYFLGAEDELKRTIFRVKASNVHNYLNFSQL